MIDWRDHNGTDDADYYPHTIDAQLDLDQHEQALEDAYYDDDDDDDLTP